ncbi:MAG: division/cell wall cluster transcriptional repressor MraZ [Xanthomonadales bacterium]|nr:division/cell wall cluster transcriptional repressor MraZ [Xanthomonadales bacterium]MCB1626835.1 division/cell wall cluster transcriptional repressor MraZ [Xanthomonadales bacterium]MCB1643152.1 division/cell wall cluster transcriptional repressor MraZ [Xanthomonadales bacterium]
MFYGESMVAIDDKGRMAMPVMHREALAQLCAGQLMVTYNPFEAQCLLLFPRGEWERIRDQLAGLKTFERAHREMVRKLVGAAHGVELDGQGRIVLPHSPRQVVGLERRGVLLGMGSKFELWTEAAHRAQMERPIDAADTTEAMRELDI